MTRWPVESVAFNLSLAEATERLRDSVRIKRKARDLRWITAEEAGRLHTAQRTEQITQLELQQRILVLMRQV